MRHLKDEIANLQEFEVLLCIRNNDDRRFKLRVCVPGGVEGATWKGMPWEPTAVKAVQGHKDWVIERIGNRAICQEIYSLDDEFDVDKLDRGYRPRLNSDPETSHSYTTFPRVVYHFRLIFAAVAISSRMAWWLAVSPAKRGEDTIISRSLRHGSRICASSREREPDNRFTWHSTQS